jgi:hypothetical protein
LNRTINQMGNTEAKGNVGLEHPKLKEGTINPDKKIILNYKYPENYQEWTNKLEVFRKQFLTQSLFLPKI